jgi:FlaA1/EpsC-like NDP-sugar epimerase
MLDGAELAQHHSADLLGRAELGEPPTVAARWLANRRVLITGAGGSVGRPLAAAIVQAKPAQLVLLDHHEASLWDLHRRFGGEAGVVNLVPADIRNGPRLAAIFERWGPEVVFHLAAYKHVPFGEVFSDEVFAVNVLATRTILELAAEHGAERFVYPSSDKACDPPSLYGATKRLGEVVVRHTADRTGLPYNVARFVNILGTQGSVIETFAQQIHDRQPLTVTDAAMKRYWIGMNEAVWLLLTVGALRDGGNTLMLDAREEIGVVEMARRVCRLLRGDASACQIAYGRPRAGERLSEQLLSASERFETGDRPELLRVCDARTDEHLDRLPALLEQLGKLATLGQASTLREATMAAARELQ